jgi:hypothetical protein
MQQGDHNFKAEAMAFNALFEGHDPLRAAHDFCFEKELSTRRRKMGRYVLDPTEILSQKDKVLIVAPGAGVPPILADKLPPYWTNPAMAGRYGPDPLFPPLDRVTIRHPFWGKIRRKFIRKDVPSHLAHLPNHSNGEIAYVQGYKTW